MDSAMILKKLHYNQLITEFPMRIGLQTSKVDRAAINDYENRTLIYGEANFENLAEIFDNVRQTVGEIPSGNFYDLGSGLGKICLSAALLHPFDQCIGIEILQGLYDHSVALGDTYKDQFPQLVTDNPDTYQSVPELSFIKGDLFETPLVNPSVIFTNSTCFGPELMERMSEIPVNEDTIFLTTIKKLSAPWEILHEQKYRMSYGDATVFIWRKSSN